MKLASLFLYSTIAATSRFLVADSSLCVSDYQTIPIIKGDIGKLSADFKYRTERYAEPSGSSYNYVSELGGVFEVNNVDMNS